MGDMAREALLRGELEEELLEGYLDGYLSDEDAYENGLVDEQGTLCPAGAKYAAERRLCTSEDLDEEITNLLYRL